MLASPALLATDSTINQYAKLSTWAIVVLFGGAMAWGALYPLDGAVVSSGTVVIDGNVKKVQHQTGGIIGAILVKEGSRVKEGDIVARLDETQARANLGIILADVMTQRARSARLGAERDDLTAVVYAPDLITRSRSDADVKAILDSETVVFHTRRSAREGQKKQLSERAAQFRQEIEGFEKQLGSTEDQQKIAQEERAMLEPLRLKGLVQRPRLTALEREIARNIGTMGDAKARIEQSRARIREVDVQIAQIDRERAAEATKDLRETEAKMAESHERRLAAEDQLRRVDIRAPASGVVHELQVHTVGGVINQAEALMLIVPEPDNLVVEARVSPNDRDQISVDQKARVRFTTFNQRITPEFNAHVSRISPNTSRDQQTGATFYTIGLRLTEGQTHKFHGSTLLPGMTADTFITTDPRTALSFLFKPISDNFDKIFAGR
jgi:HlyD family secretion protein